MSCLCVHVFVWSHYINLSGKWAEMQITMVTHPSLPYVGTRQLCKQTHFNTFIIICGNLSVTYLCDTDGAQRIQCCYCTHTDILTASLHYVHTYMQSEIKDAETISPFLSAIVQRLFDVALRPLCTAHVWSLCGARDTFFWGSVKNGEEYMQLLISIVSLSPISLSFWHLCWGAYLMHI